MLRFTVMSAGILAMLHSAAGFGLTSGSIHAYVPANRLQASTTCGMASGATDAGMLAAQMQADPGPPACTSGRICRRDALRAAVALASLPFSVRADGDTELVANKIYNGPTSYGFKFKYPAKWKGNKRIGNKHLYDLEVKPDKGPGVISVTIDKTSAKSIAEFGSLDAVTEKLRASFKKGDSIEILTAREETTRDKKMTYYTIELQVLHDCHCHTWRILASKRALTTHKHSCLARVHTRTFVKMQGPKSKQYNKITATAQQLFSFKVDVPLDKEASLSAMAQQVVESVQERARQGEGVCVAGLGR